MMTDKPPNLIFWLLRKSLPFLVIGAVVGGIGGVTIGFLESILHTAVP